MEPGKEASGGKAAQAKGTATAKMQTKSVLEALEAVGGRDSGGRVAGEEAGGPRRASVSVGLWSEWDGKSLDGQEVGAI